jgi:integrase
MNPTRGIEKYPEEGRERFLRTDELTRLGDAIREAETIGLPYAIDGGTPKAKHAPKEENRRTVIGPHAAAAMRLLILTGARLREILHLRWDHVDFERGMLLLPDSKTGRKATRTSVAFHDPAEIGFLIKDDRCDAEWPFKKNCLYVTKDLYGVADRVFLPVYRERLRRLLAEAVPGAGGLRVVPEW